MPADASSPVPPAIDQLREHPGALPEETPGLLERLAEVPDPRDPRRPRRLRRQSASRPPRTHMITKRTSRDYAEALPQEVHRVTLRCPTAVLGARLASRVVGEAHGLGEGAVLGERGEGRGEVRVERRSLAAED